MDRFIQLETNRNANAEIIVTVLLRRKLIILADKFSPIETLEQT